MKIIEFCGVSGCGKSTLINAYIEKLGKSNFKVKKLCCKFYRNNVISKIKRKIIFFALKITPINIRLNYELKKVINGQKSANNDWIFQILLMNWRLHKAKRSEFVFLDEGIVQSIGALYFDTIIEDDVLISRIYKSLSTEYRQNVYIIYCKQDYNIAVEQLRKRNRIGDRYLKGSDDEIKSLYTIQERNLLFLTNIFSTANQFEIDLRKNIEVNINFINSKLNGSSNELVSVVIPTYSRNDKLIRAIESVLKQTYRNIEIIVVDDNKTDSEWRLSTQKIMEEYADNNKVKYIQNSRNLGGAGARNEGIKVSRGEYIAFLDDDDEYYPEKVEKQLKKFIDTENSKLALVYCDAQYATSKGDVNYTDKKRCSGSCIFEAMYYNCIAATSQWMCKKSALEDVGGFVDVPSKQDSQLILKLLKYGYELDFVPEVLSKYYIPEGEEGSNISNSDKIIKGEKLYYEACQELFYLLSEKQQKKVNYTFARYFYMHYKRLKDENNMHIQKRKMFKLNCCKSNIFFARELWHKIKRK